MIATPSSIRHAQHPHLRLVPPWVEPVREDEPLDETVGFQGLGRSQTFPFQQYRADDEYRTVYFDEGSGHPLVFVHGLGGNATHWEYLAPHFADQYRVAGLDAAGCGWNLKPHVTYTVDLLRDHLLSFMDYRGIGQATLVGHSLGGMVCLAAALKKPSRVASLALVNSAGLAPLPSWMRMAAPVFLHRSLLFYTLAAGADFILNNVFVQSEDENRYVRAFRQSNTRDDPGYPNLRDFARVSESLCRDVVSRDYSAQLRQLKIPVLVLTGDNDKLTPSWPVLRRLNRIRRVRTVVLKRCGHMPMIEYPEETRFHLDRFLNNPP